jgi:transcriptional regulator PpsR
MVDTPLARPDITLTLDADGVIQNAVSAEGLAGEGLSAWLGRPWRETIDPAVESLVQKMIRDIRTSGVSSFVKVTQRLPSGREVPMEYTTFSLGEKAGFVAIGKNLQVISDLQSRLQLAQQERERDYWKMREIETRYRMLFDASTEASVLVLVANQRIVEANVAAIKSLGLLPGSEFFPDLDAHDRQSFEAMLEQVREQGRAPGIAFHVPGGKTLYSLRASLMKSESGLYYLFQMAPLGPQPTASAAKATFSVDDIIQRLPDGFAVVDMDGTIRRVNHTFLDLVHMGSETAVIGQNLKRWLSQPGADLSVLMGLVLKHGSVTRMNTVLQGEFGTDTTVEISAVGNRTAGPDYVGLLLRDTTMRSAADAAAAPMPAIPITAAAPVVDFLHQDLTLEQLVKASTESIEQSAIVSVLHQCQGNRTVAARRLGLSRQSLHTKLKKYSLEER